MKKHLLGQPVIFTNGNSINYGILVGLTNNDKSVIKLPNGINVTTDYEVFEDTTENRKKLIDIQFGRYDVKPLMYSDTDTVQPFILPTLSPFNTKEEVEYVLNLISKEIVEEDHRLALDLLPLLRLRVDRLEFSLRKELNND